MTREERLPTKGTAMAAKKGTGTHSGGPGHKGAKKAKKSAKKAKKSAKKAKKK
jgi:hypothetical protein